MLYSVNGYPEEDEIVLCKVTKIYPNSVFVDLLEYEGKFGIIHISEVSPGRIRNLRDFVSIGRQIVCKVLRVDEQKGHIDLSLRRVNSNQRREKLEEVKQEMKAEQLLKNLATKLKKPADQIYKEVTDKVFKEYSHLYLAFKDIVSEEFNLEELGIKKDLANEIKEAVLEKFKPKKIIIEGEIKIQTFAPNGVNKVKNVLIKIEKISDTISLSYLGAGRYRIHIEDFEYKNAEKTLAEVIKLLEDFNDKVSTGTFIREKSD
ncbi:MAG: S1 RNA-binding domain-containing protein [archaeon]|nr:S1 RNA-binding domain-containing protein [archaeon]